ncbi:MAG: hypothetical protein ACK53L_26550, partial [Pirellulaceae bacterium]
SSPPWCTTLPMKEYSKDIRRMKRLQRKLETDQMRHVLQPTPSDILQAAHIDKAVWLTKKKADIQ